MARKLKTYQTTLGFFELAVAAPSMKAALEAWGAKSNLFQLDFAKESADPKLIKATLEKPGVVLRRAVGTTGKFTEHPSLPEALPDTAPPPAPAKATEALPKPGPSRKKEAAQSQRAADEFREEQARREHERQQAAERRQREATRRQSAIAKAKAERREAEEQHLTIVEAIAASRAELDEKEKQEEARWNKLRKRLEAKMQGLRDG